MVAEMRRRIGMSQVLGDGRLVIVLQLEECFLSRESSSSLQQQESCGIHTAKRQGFASFNVIHSG